MASWCNHLQQKICDKTSRASPLIQYSVSLSFFCKQSTEIPAPIQTGLQDPSTDVVSKNVPCDNKKVGKFLKGLNDNKSSGLTKYLPVYLKRLLTHLQFLWGCSSIYHLNRAAYLNYGNRLILQLFIRMVTESQWKIIEAFHFYLLLGNVREELCILLFTIKLSVSCTILITDSSLVVAALLNFSWYIMIGSKFWIRVAKPMWYWWTFQRPLTLSVMIFCLPNYTNMVFTWTCPVGVGII